MKLILTYKCFITPLLHVGVWTSWGAAVQWDGCMAGTVGTIHVIETNVAETNVCLWGVEANLVSSAWSSRFLAVSSCGSASLSTAALSGKLAAKSFSSSSFFFRVSRLSGNLAFRIHSLTLWMWLKLDDGSVQHKAVAGWCVCRWHSTQQQQRLYADAVPCRKSLSSLMTSRVSFKSSSSSSRAFFILLDKLAADCLTWLVVSCVSSSWNEMKRRQD